MDKMFRFCEFWLFAVFTFVVCEKEPIVKIKDGILAGALMKTVEGRPIYAFPTIPFAEPPIGERRFQPPIPVVPWKGTFNSSRDDIECPQRNIYIRSERIHGQEDCLYLGVYTPHLPDGKRKPLPVMVFFHGGGWLAGSGNIKWYSPTHLLDEDVVLVSPNYRLGALGFLSTGDEVVPGNNALKDQTLALKWVQKNIAQFGGDPNSVTIFGESAGGASVHYHMLSPLSKGLFKGAISQSGTALTSWAFSPKDQAIRHARKLASLVKCPIQSTEEMVDCLKTIDAYKLIEQDKKFMYWDFDPMIPFKPVMEPKLEGAFICEDPIDVIKSGRTAQVPWIVGINTEDGALRTAGIFGHPHLVEELDEQFERVVPISLLYDQTSDQIDYVTKKIRLLYFGGRKIDNSSVAEVTNMYTDGWFLQGNDDAVRLHLDYSKSPVYYYLFGYRGDCSFTAIFGDAENDYGVCHADELQYLFPIYCKEERSENDRIMKNMFVKLWTNFAKTGDPTPKPTELLPHKWKPVSSKVIEYYSIKTPKNTEMKEKLLSDRTEFWRTLPTDPRRFNILKDEL